MINKQKIEQLLLTLNSIEVHGKDNMDKLLACIVFLEAELKEMDKPKESEEDNG